MCEDIGEQKRVHETSAMKPDCLAAKEAIGVLLSDLNILSVILKINKIISKPN